MSLMPSSISRLIPAQLRKQRSALNSIRKKTTDLPRIGLERRCSAILPTLTNSRPNGSKSATNMESGGGVAVMLIPARTDTKRFHEYIYGNAEIRFIKGRLKFGGCENSAPFPSMIVVFGKEPTERRPRPMGRINLRDYQLDAIKRMKNGCILCGGVGSGCKVAIFSHRMKSP